MASGTTTPKSLDDFVQYMGREEEIAKYSKQANEDSRASKRDEADKKLREGAYETLKEVAHPGIDFSTITADTLSGDYVNEGINLRINMARQDSARVLTDKLDEVVDNLKEDKLEELALEENILNKGGKNNAELINHYRQYLGIKELVDDYNKGQVKDPEKLAILHNAGARKAGEEMKAKMKAKGYSRDLQERAGGLASIAAREGNVNESYVKDGAKKLAADAEKEYRDYETSKGKKIKDYVAETLKELAKGNTEEFEKARKLVYHAAK